MPVREKLLLYLFQTSSINIRNKIVHKIENAIFKELWKFLKTFIVMTKNASSVLLTFKLDIKKNWFYCYETLIWLKFVLPFSFVGSNTQHPLIIPNWYGETTNIKCCWAANTNFKYPFIPKHLFAITKLVSPNLWCLKYHE